MKKICFSLILSALFTGGAAWAFDDFKDLDPVSPDAFPLKPLMQPDLSPPDSNPLKTLRENSPNFDKGAISNSLNLNGSRLDPYDANPGAPLGNDIRDYNPYYNRDGSLK